MLTLKDGSIYDSIFRSTLVNDIWVFTYNGDQYDCHCCDCICCKNQIAIINIIGSQRMEMGCDRIHNLGFYSSYISCIQNCNDLGIS